MVDFGESDKMIKNKRKDTYKEFSNEISFFIPEFLHTKQNI